MKKCPYCAEEIQDEATICRFCNKKLIKINYLSILRVFLIIALLSILSLSYYKYGNKKSTLLKENKQLIASVCLEVDNLIGFLLSPSTYGESQDRFNNYVEILKVLKTKVASESVSALNKNDKILLNDLLLMVDNALALSENRLKATNYGLQNFALKQYIKSERDRAHNIRSLEAYANFRDDWPNQIDRNTDTYLKQAEDKEKMIEDLDKESSVLLSTLYDRIFNFTDYLDKYGFNIKAVFPSINRELEKGNK